MGFAMCVEFLKLCAEVEVTLQLVGLYTKRTTTTNYYHLALCVIYFTNVAVKNFWYVTRALTINFPL